MLSVLRDVQTGKIAVKDFDNHTGSIKLKLATIRHELLQIDNIHQTLAQRQQEICTLEEAIRQKREFLAGVRIEPQAEAMDETVIEAMDDAMDDAVDGPDVSGA